MTATVRGRTWALVWIAVIVIVGARLSGVGQGFSDTAAHHHDVGVTKAESRPATETPAKLGRTTRIIRGRVANATGASLPQAQVKWAPTTEWGSSVSYEGRTLLARERKVTLGPDARFEIEVHYLDVVDVIAELDGYAPQCIQVAARSDAEIAFALREPLTVTGIVVDADSLKPVEGVSVTACDEERLVERTTRTDSQGSYQLTGLALGPIRLTARASRRMDYERHLELTAARTLHNPALVPARLARLQVVSTETKLPIADANVIVDGVVVRTDAAGMATIANLSPRQIEAGWLRLVAPDHGSGHARIRDIPPNDTVVVDLDRVTHVISGIVLGADGLPVDGAFVTSKYLPAPHRVLDEIKLDPNANCHSGRDGRYVLRVHWSARDRELSIQAWHPTWGVMGRGLQPGDAMAGSVANCNTDLKFSLRDRELRGRIVDANGVPVSDAELRLQRSAQPPPMSSYEYVAHCATDATGAFQFDHLTPGYYEILRDERHSRSPIHQATISTTSPAITDILLKIDRPIIVRGSVHDVLGRPLDGWIEVDSKFHVHWPRFRNGPFEFYMKESDRSRVVFGAGGYVKQSVRVPSSNEVQVVLQEDLADPCVTIAGSVFDRSGEAPSPKDRCTVFFTRIHPSGTALDVFESVGTRPDMWRDTDAQGNFKMKLLPGKYRVAASYGSRVGRIDVIALHTQTPWLTLELEEMAGVEVAIESPAEFPTLEAEKVLVHPANTNVVEECESERGSAGSWIVPYMYAGDVDVVIFARANYVLSGKYNVQATNLVWASLPSFKVPPGARFKKQVKLRAPTLVNVACRVVRENSLEPNVPADLKSRLTIFQHGNYDDLWREKFIVRDDWKSKNAPRDTEGMVTFEPIPTDPMKLFLPPGRFEFQLQVGYEVSKKEVIVEHGKPQSVSLEILVPKAK